MSVSRSTLRRSIAADARALRTTTVKPSNRISRALRLRLMCNKNQKDLLDEVAATMGPSFYLPYGRTVDRGKLERLLGSLPDRGLFVPEGVPAYEDFPTAIFDNGKYLTTISQLSVQVFTLLELEPYLPSKGRALDVGSGSGYITACLSNFAGRQGRVIGVEDKASAYDYGKSCIERWNKSALEDGSVTLTKADVFGDQPSAYSSLKNSGPYDVIHVGAAVTFPEEVMRLLDLLKPGGAMFVPQYQNDDAAPLDGVQVLVKYTKSEQGLVKAEDLTPVQFVPLTRNRPKDG